MASGGYPGEYRTGFPVDGLENAGPPVLHAGTKSDGGNVLTSGGRVLGFTAMGQTAAQAVTAAYGAVQRIRFENAARRTDIGAPDPV